MSGRALLRLTPADNVATALEPLHPGTTVELGDLALAVLEPVPLCHKVALVNLAPGDSVVKYGQPIGRATAPIRAGGHVHVHNMASDRGRGLSGGGRAVEGQADGGRPQSGGG